MAISPELGNLFKISSGIFWSLTYVLIIRRGFKDGTFGMPLAALCANISWEFIFSFVHPHTPPQLYVDITWFVLDILIACQLLRYGPDGFQALLPKGGFYVLFVLSLALSFALVLGISIEFNNWIGTYTAFGQNLMMSILFVLMLRTRNTLDGQSIYIAVFKMLGTLLASVYIFLLVPSSLLMNTLFVSIFGFDLLYSLLVYAKHRELGLQPWRRF
jgi:hypothetical protein